MSADSVNLAGEGSFREILPGKIRAVIDFVRPFTLVMPVVGFLSAGIVAMGARPALGFNFDFILPLVFGSLSLSFLNAAANTLNQIYDLEIDRINKPERPLPSGRLTIKEGWIITLLLYSISLALANQIGAQGFALIVLIAIITFIYSGLPFRTKRFGFFANFTIAVPRGCLLKVAGWSAVRSAYMIEPWFMGFIFFLYLLGAQSTKDFSDVEGDRAFGCVTLPIKYGMRQASRIIVPFIIFPWLLMPAGSFLGVLTGDRLILSIGGLLLSIWGIYVSHLLLRNPEELALERNHPSWKQMYLMLMGAQVTFALAYMI